MAITEQDFLNAEKRMAAQRAAGFAVSARYDRQTARIVVDLSTGVEIAVPTRLVEGLADAPQDDLTEIEISPAGLGLHWPKLDADVYVPGLLQGVFGSKRSIAAELGAAGGRARSDAKAAAAQENGRKGGRPRKAVITTPKAPSSKKLEPSSKKAAAKHARKGPAKTAAKRRHDPHRPHRRRLRGRRC